MPDLQDPKLLRQHAYIDGQWCEAQNGEQLHVLNPANGEIIAKVPLMGAADTDLAIDAAHSAFGDWKRLSAKQRGKILRSWYELIMNNQQNLAILLSLEQGKPLAESLGEIAYGASFVEWYAEEAKRLYGDIIPAPLPDRRYLVLKQPIGVAAAITPWNFPHAMITRKCAPALAAGCTVVVKPAEDTPLSALALAALAERAGIPAGVFNVVTSDKAHAGEIGKALTDSKLVRKLSFTGSTEVGKLLMRQCADTVKKLSLELGGNAPFIVFDDADLEAAVAGAMASKYRNSGQTCVCANRLFVQDGIYDEFVARLTQAVEALHVADAFDEGAQQGPLINQAAVHKVEHHIEDALTKGARLVTGGKRHAKGGTYFQPTVLADASLDMACAYEETFGPVAPVFRFYDEQQAIRMANDSEAGLAGYFYARDIGRIWRVAEALECGIVGVNEGIVSTEVAPFGGIKQSGIGREGSRYGLEEFVEIKYVCLGGIEAP